MTTQLHRTTSVALGSVALIAGLVALTAPALAAPATPVPVGTPPDAVISVPSTVYAGIPITLSGAKSTTPTGGVSEWEWSLDGKGGYERDSTSSPWVSKAFTKGKHTVKLRVRNTAGLVATATKTFTVRPAPAAAAEPLAPVSVTAVADGTAVDVTWVPATGPAALAYRVTNGEDADTDPVYVPAGQDASTTFDGLVPGDYVIRVAGVNAAGAGPAAQANAAVVPKGGPTTSPTATATPTSTATDSPSASASVATSSADTAVGSSGDNRDTIGIVLISVGALVLLGAAITAGVAAWRRRRSAV